MVEKKTTKKTATKAVAKKPVRKTTNVATKKPTVRVETKKISNPRIECNVSDFCNCCTLVKRLAFAIIFLLNTVLLIIVAANQSKVEIMKAGGKENYRILKQIYKTDWYKEQQNQQLLQALQIYSNPEQFMPSFDDMEYIDYEDMEEYYLE